MNNGQGDLSAGAALFYRTPTTKRKKMIRRDVV